MNSTSVNFHMSDGCRIEVAPLGDNWTLEFGDYPSRVTVFVTAEQLDGIRHAISVAQFEAGMAECMANDGPRFDAYGRSND